ncbi:hypothetical protein [Streptomyces sp. KL110A]|uniref:hypothetical protein n=1 Tax=Streptomyces sp. KL110A TaxID=3384221 RepID=UPI0038C9F6DF
MTIEQPDGAGEPGYRFNASSMGPAKAAMDRLGMLSHEHEAPCPRLEDFGLTMGEVYAAQGPGAPERPEPVHAYLAAQAAAFEWQAEQPTGIPEYKIGYGNDGWLVTPAEIRVALTALEGQPESAKAGTMAEDSRWDEWIDYLRRAEAHGGFRVE